VDPAKVFTVGHSTSSLEQFLGLLAREGATHLVDVRAFPASARYPHFSRPALERTIIDSGGRYTHFPSLGGRRRGKRDSHNTQWRNSSFRAYADYMQTREFEVGIAELDQRRNKERVCVMCSEAVWWRCHRRMIADAEVAQGIPVRHIMSETLAARHQLTNFAVVTKRRGRPPFLTYPD